MTLKGIPVQQLSGVLPITGIGCPCLSGNPNSIGIVPAAVAAIKVLSVATGLPFTDKIMEKVSGLFDQIGAKFFPPGENGQDLPGGWIEYWKYMKGSPLYNLTPSTTPVSVGYWRTQWYPGVYNAAKSVGLNPPPPPSKDDKEGIQKAVAFNAAWNDLFVKYYHQIKDYSDWNQVWSKMVSLNNSEYNNQNGGNGGNQNGSGTGVQMAGWGWLAGGLLVLVGIGTFLKPKIEKSI